MLVRYCRDTLLSEREYNQKIKVAPIIALKICAQLNQLTVHRLPMPSNNAYVPVDTYRTPRAYTITMSTVCACTARTTLDRRAPPFSHVIPRRGSKESLCKHGGDAETLTVLMTTSLMVMTKHQAVVCVQYGRGAMALFDNGSTLTGDV